MYSVSATADMSIHLGLFYEREKAEDLLGTVTEGDAPATQVIGRQLDCDGVAGKNFNVELAHFSRGMRQDRHLIF